MIRTPFVLSNDLDMKIVNIKAIFMVMVFLLFFVMGCSEDECPECDTNDEDDSIRSLLCNDSFRDTNKGHENNLANYSCISIPMSGPETIYWLIVNEPVTLSITISEAHVDLLLFLIPDDLDASGCYQFYENKMEQELDAGRYALVIEGKNGATADYRISVKCNF